ncbi:Serine/threonine-protein kinase [Serendipita sp. 411]|nr:Serine/threonine-protein kinase [Serendipita sp. 411]
MIDLNPSLRPTFDTILATARGDAFPESFYEFYHDYVHSIEELPSPSPFATTSYPSASTLPSQASRPSNLTITPAIEGTNTPTSAHPTTSVFSASSNVTTFFQGGTVPHPPQATSGLPEGRVDRREGSTKRTSLPRDGDRRIDSIWAGFERVVPFLNQEIPETQESGINDWSDSRNGLSNSGFKTLSEILPVQIDIPNIPSTLPGVRNKNTRSASQDGTALIILSLICSNMRSCVLPSSKLKALDILLFLSCYLTDEAKLDRLVPYIVDLVHDDAAIVRAAAVRAILQVVSLVSVITPANASIIPEYILFNTKHLASDRDLMVRCIYAQCLVPLASIGLQYLEMSQALKVHGAKRLGPGAEIQDESYDSARTELQNAVQEHLVTLLVDKSSVVKRAVLNDTSSLCIFLERQRANDILLSHMLTYLNDRDWMLRYAFFQSVVDVALCVGGRSLDEYILPLMVQALSDTEEAVVAKVLQALTELSDLGLFQKMRIWEFMSAVLGFLYHPNVWIRQAAVSFLASAARKLPRTDVWCILYPSLRYFLRSDVRDLNEGTLLAYIKPSVPRPIFDAVVTWAKNSDKTQFWKANMTRSKVSGSEAIRESLSNLKKSVNLSLRGSAAKSEEDDQQIARLQNMGMSPAEEAKLLAMKEYITRLVDPRSSRLSNRPEQKSEQELLLTGKGTINLQKLGAVLQTIFIGGTTIPGRRPEGSRRSTLTDTPRWSSPSAITSPRILPVDRKDSGHMEDLRKRLLSVDGSSVSIHQVIPLTKDRERRESTNSVQSSSALHLSPMLDKSPPESVTSGEASASALGKRRQRIQLSTDGKAPPLVGSIRTNVTSLLETSSTLRPVQEDSVAPSGRSSPVSQTGTLKKDHRPSHLTVNTIPYSEGDAAIATMVEHMHSDHGPESMHDFGPRIKNVPLRRRNNVRAPLHGRDPEGGKLDITLVANIMAHNGPVNALVVAPDHAFFVSCSDDSTVKVWDTARLERNVTRKPRHVYIQHHASVTALCMLENSHCFASAASDGSLHVVRVHITYSNTSVAKYGKISIVREHRVDHAGEYITVLSHYHTENTSNLIYGTTHGNVVVLDLRTMRVLQQFSNPTHFGAITSMCVDRGRTWIVTGTLSGTLTLWDIRFGISLKSWKVGSSSTGPITRTTRRIHQCVTHPTNRQWILVSSEAAQDAQEDDSAVLVEVWDLEKTSIVETFVTRDVSVPSRGQAPMVITSVNPSSSSSPSALPQSPADAIAALLASRSAAVSTTTAASRFLNPLGISTNVPVEDGVVPKRDVRSLIVGLDFGAQAGAAVIKDGFVFTGAGIGLSSEKRNKDLGFVIMGSEDRKLRIWYPGQGQIERSTIVSGLDGEMSPPSYSTIRSTIDSPPSHTEIWSHLSSKEKERQRNATRANFIGHYQQDLLRSHRDCISAIACIDSPFRGGIISADRSGVIKVYRVLEGEP